MKEFDFIENERLRKQIEFLVTIDRMKEILRRTVLIDKSKRENDAEHSWHLALYAMILKEYCAEETDIERVIKIVLIHDLVEVYAGDTFAYDAAAHLDKEKREKEAAAKLFDMLDADQRDEINALWEEFEQGKTPEARFALVCDRLQPLIHNFLTEGHTWQEGRVQAHQVLERNNIAVDTAPEIRSLIEKAVEISVEKGILLPD
jgi:putative hydrolase of HD superfamily